MYITFLDSNSFGITPSNRGALLLGLLREATDCAMHLELLDSVSENACE